jgi:predicted  nucleic acid-binding Zn-ribbon protein
LNEQLNLLIKLQEIDSDILSITEEIELLPNKLSEARIRLKDTKSSFEKISSDYALLEKKKKSKEDELEEIEEKINKLKAKSTEIKTNKEYEAHLKEIQNFENNKFKVEEEIISAMEKIDEFTKLLKKEEAQLKGVEEEFKREEKTLDNERNKLNSRMEAIKAKRNDMVVRIDKEIYGEYMDKIKSAGGVAVVETKDEVCMGCHTNIPPQLYNDIKSGENIYTCYHCNRFLFFLSSSKPSETRERHDSAHEEQ